MFLWQLGRELGVWNVPLMAAQMSPGIRKKWMAVFRLEKDAVDRGRLETKAKTNQALAAAKAGNR